MGRLIPAGTGMEFYRNVKVAHDPTMQDVKTEEVDDTQSYIEQMVAATAGRALPQAEPEEEFEGDEGELEEDSFLGEEPELAELGEEEFAFESENDEE